MSNGQSPRSTAVVIGGSMAGLSAAAVLAARFESVVIVERDVVPDHPADRKGVPQGRHAHGLLPPGMIPRHVHQPRNDAQILVSGTGGQPGALVWTISRMVRASSSSRRTRLSRRLRPASCSMRASR